MQIFEVARNATWYLLLLRIIRDRLSGTDHPLASNRSILLLMTAMAGVSFTLFATPYQELTELGLLKPRVRNFQVLVTEAAGEIVFLHRLAPGAAPQSYGIQVAKLAGVPGEVIARAQEVLENLEAGSLDPMGLPRLARSRRRPSRETPQPGLFDLPSKEPR